MSARPEELEAIVSDAARRHEGAEAFVRQVVEREGAPAVVAAVARLLRAHAPRAGEGLLFLMLGDELPVLLSAIEDDPNLAAVLDEMIFGPNVRERGVAIWALGALPVRDRHEILERAAPRLLAEKELVSLASLLTVIELAEMIDRLVESEDWLFRWALLPWTNQATDSAIAGDVRRRLAFDDHPLVSREAHQHLMIIEEFETKAASAPGYVFAVLSNHGSATSFGAMSAQFVQSWPAEKTAYTLEELREFALRFEPEP
jgi:hypothetical protein